MSEKDSSEKSEKATPHKVREARKKGMVAKSLDVNSLLIMGAALLLMYAVGNSLVQQSFVLSRKILLEAGQFDFQIGKLMLWSGWVFSRGLFILAAFVIPLMLVAVLSSLLQTGPVFSVFPLKPDFKKLNPVTGFKRIFSIKLLVELVKSLLKISLFACVLYFTFMQYLPEYMGLMHRSPYTYVTFFIKVSAVLIVRLLLVLAFIALLDFLFSRREYQKKLRMSKKEVKDEHKRFEGDPLVKQKRKELSRELLNRSKSLGNVASADVVITNPVRFAVAIKYDRNTMVAPKTVSKGRGGLAARIRQLAGSYGVPVIESPPLARKLFRTTKVDGFIHPDDYVEVAKILRDVYARKSKKRATTQQAH